jgi:DNA-binding response OmpR family regulator
MAIKILVVDDEKASRKTLGDILRLEGYDVITAADGTKALAILEEDNIDLMLLDIRMPGIDGVEVMQKTPEISSDTQIIMLTAHGTMESAIEALRYGAYDYLIKPSSPHEILSSVASALARHAEMQRKKLILGQMETSLQQLKNVEGISQSNLSGQRAITLHDGVMVDLSRRQVWRGNERVNLTPTEGKLLRVLLENKGRVMTHQALVFLVQGYEIAEWEAPEVLRPLVSRLRRKLAVFPGGNRWISNVRGTGYVFDLQHANHE